MSHQPPKPTLLARLRARLPKVPSRRPVPPTKPARAPAPLDLTEEEIATIQHARFLKQVGQEGETVALWRAVTAARDETRHQVRRGLIALAALQILLAVGLAVLPRIL